MKYGHTGNKAPVISPRFHVSSVFEVTRNSEKRTDGNVLNNIEVQIRTTRTTLNRGVHLFLGSVRYTG